MIDMGKVEKLFDRVLIDYGWKQLRHCVRSILEDPEYLALSADEKAAFALLLLGQLNFGNGNRP